MNSKNYWTSKGTNGQWLVKKEGGERASSKHKTQEEAWKEARRLARGTEGEAFLKGSNGKIRARNSYGYDPFPPKG